nr:hypothetical protein [Mucilaginibacter sp. FT3.2]
MLCIYVLLYLKIHLCEVLKLKKAFSPQGESQNKITNYITKSHFIK